MVFLVFTSLLPVRQYASFVGNNCTLKVLLQVLKSEEDFAGTAELSPSHQLKISTVYKLLGSLIKAGNIRKLLIGLLFGRIGFGLDRLLPLALIEKVANCL